MTRPSRLLARVDWRSPITWFVVVVGLIRVVGIGWGLPASDGWDNDGVAPRDFLPGLLETFRPGHFYTYPPLHLAILAILTLPVTLVALVRAASFAPADLVAEAIKTPYMTAIAYVARALSLGMSLAIVVFIARTAREIRAHELGTDERDRRVQLVGGCTAVFAGLNSTLTYYAHTTNLDVPYLFWATWGLLSLVRAITRDEPRRLRTAFLFAALAVTTKDQAYALFLFSVPGVLAVWLATNRQRWRSILRETAIGVARALAVVLVIDGVVINPSGFRARVGFLTGSASQDYAEYANDAHGWWRIVVDGVLRSPVHYPFVLSALVVVGLARGQRRVLVRWVPLLAAASFTLAFNFTARRTDARFYLPQALMLAVDGGIGLAWLVSRHGKLTRPLGQAAAAVAVATALFRCAAVDANLRGDPRYDTEAWLRQHVHEGDTIETYGQNVYLPRFPPGTRTIRVGPDPSAHKNPLPDVEEILAPFDGASQRNARLIVVSTAWVWRYLLDPAQVRRDERVLPATQKERLDDERSVHYFERLARGEEPFVRVHESRYDDRLFPLVDVHGTTTRWVWIFERKADALPARPPLRDVGR